MTEAAIQLALRDVYDPETPLNIIELGIVENVALAEDHEAPGAGIPSVPKRFRATISITPVNPDSEATPMLIERIKNRLAGLEAISETVVILLDSPRWTPQRITPAGYAQLEAQRLQKNLIQIKIQ